MADRLKDTLLLIGDKDSDRMVLRNIFEFNYTLLEAESVSQALFLLSQNAYCIAAVLADIPIRSGHLKNLVKACGADTIPIILFVTPGTSGEQEERAFLLGAADVIHKPYTPYGLQRRVQSHVEKHLHRSQLENLVRSQSETIRNTYQIMLDALSTIIEHRSTESGNHILRIRSFTKLLLEEVAGFCPEYNLTKEAIDSISSASALHDIGKISIPDAILNKPGKLTADEFAIMKTHTTIGSELIQTLTGMGDETFLRYAYNICLYHHERWDGCGYPLGLCGEEIPICAQIVGIADAFDALTTERVYKPAFSCQKSFNMILNGDCGKFSPKLLECLKRVRTSFIELAHRYADGSSPKSDIFTIPLPAPQEQTHRLNSLQMAQLKYQTILHHVNATVMEIDFSAGIYHIIYNPNPNFSQIASNQAASGPLSVFAPAALHPDDKPQLLHLAQRLEKEFFQQNMRKKILSFRIYEPTAADYRVYNLTLLRLNTGNPADRMVLAICYQQPSLPNSSQEQSMQISPAFADLAGAMLLCQNADSLTFVSAAGLSALTGYSDEEIADRFCGGLPGLVHPDDLSIVLDSLNRLNLDGSKTTCQYRICHHAGHWIWVWDTSCLYTAPDGQTYCSRFLTDISEFMEKQHALEAENRRNQRILAQIDDITFEWDLKTDRLYCSEKWEQRFGLPYLSEGYSSQLELRSHFHPDDLNTVRSRLNAMANGLRETTFDVRLSNKAGQYLWNRIRASAVYDAHGNPDRVIGTISDIDELKRAALALKEKAERDALTGLLNRDSTVNLVTDYLFQREPDSFSALLVLDLDNFKSVNDTYGHLCGDNLLSQVGSTLRKLFRPHDIIGRIGGDEFLICLRDILSEEIIHSRCRILLETLKEVMGSLVPDLNISCSIGAALAPIHGSNYAELFQNADDALNLAKRRGKNQYLIYSSQETFESLLESGNRRLTRIDSDTEPGLANSSLVQFIFQKLYASTDVETAINEMLTYIGQQLGVSRIYIFENNEDNTTCSNTFEWCGDGITPEINNLQNISYITDIPGWPDVFNEQGIFYCTDIASLAPQFRAILEPQGIRSMLQCTILDNGYFRGYVGFDECTHNRVWTREQIDLLDFLSKVLAMFLLKKRARDKALSQAVNLQSILDNQDAWIYVIDPDTYRLKFLNSRVRELSPENEIGMNCYKAFQNRCTPCPGCPAKNIRQAKNDTSIIQNDKFNLTVRARASLITWDGEESCLLTCHNQTP